jgi:serine/threonine protein kinase
MGTAMADEGRLVAGRYRLISELGAGGFGRVWKARDENLRVEVAVKAVELSRAGTDEERAGRVVRAMREARNAAQLRTHPNIVAVHDVVVDGDLPWIVMELVAGHSVGEEIDAHGRLPVERVREVARAVLEALRAAHLAGIVHRDVKPSNVMLADDGRILLADFGIAVRESDTTMTGPGMLVGSPEYLAPERIEHGDDSPAGDLFSLGATLYQAAEGISPFRRPTPAATFGAILSYQPSPPRHAGRLAELITRLLVKDPGSRPTAEAALATTFYWAGPTPTGTAPPTEPPPTRQEAPVRPRRLAASYVGGLLVAAGCFIAANFLPIGGFSARTSSGIQVGHVTLTFKLIHPFMRAIATGPDAAKVYISQWIAPLVGLSTVASLALAVLFPLLLRSADPVDLEARTKSAYMLSLAWEIVFAFLLVFFIALSWINVPDTPGSDLYDRDTVQFGAWLLFAASGIVAITLQQTGKHLGLPWATKPRPAAAPVR